MYSWREETEKAIWQQLKEETVTEATDRQLKSSGTDTAATLVSHHLEHEHADDKHAGEKHADEKHGKVEETTSAAPGEQKTPPAPAKSDNKNAFGLKPEYKTAFRDFFVSAHTKLIMRFKQLTSSTENIYVFDMAG